MPSPGTGARGAGQDFTNIYHYDIINAMRRTTVMLGSLSPLVTALAKQWGLQLAAGPGTGQSDLIRLALRVVGQALPEVALPPEIARPRRGMGGTMLPLTVETADDAAAARIREAYDLPSFSAAVRAALYLVYTYGLGLAASAPRPLPSHSGSTTDD